MKTINEIEKYNSQSPFDAYNWLFNNEQKLINKYGYETTQELFNHNDYYTRLAEGDGELAAQKQAFKNRMDY